MPGLTDGRLGKEKKKRRKEGRKEGRKKECRDSECETRSVGVCFALCIFICCAGGWSSTTTMTKGIGLQKNIRRKTDRTEARDGVQVPGKLTAMQADRQAAIQADMRTSKQTTGQAD